PLDVPSHQSVDLNTIAVEVARQLEDMASARGVTIRVDANLPSLFLDPARLELVLLNLVSNAIKYSDPMKPDAFVEIALTSDTAGASVGPPALQSNIRRMEDIATQTTATQDTCTICVRDNGLGIPE